MLDPDLERILALMDRALGGQHPPRPSREEMDAFKAGYHEGFADGRRALEREQAQAKHGER